MSLKAVFSLWSMLSSSLCLKYYVNSFFCCYDKHTWKNINIWLPDKVSTLAKLRLYLSPRWRWCSQRTPDPAVSQVYSPLDPSLFSPISAMKTANPLGSTNPQWYRDSNQQYTLPLLGPQPHRAPCGSVCQLLAWSMNKMQEDILNFSEKKVAGEK